MTRLLASILALALLAVPATVVTLVSSAPAHAQSNDNDYTPLNSRIRRKKQFPTSLINPYRGEIGSASYERSRDMMAQFNGCVYDRTHEGSLELLEKTDYGFVDFSQIGLENDRAARIYGFRDCLTRVARSFNSGVQLTWQAFALRRALITEAYFDKYKNGPDWLRADYVIDERIYPISSGDASVKVAMDLADCIVAADPFTADYLYRTQAGSEQELDAIDTLVPLIQPCLPAGQRIEINPDTLRAWIGEGLWHASQHSSPPPAEEAQ